MAAHETSISLKGDHQVTSFTRIYQEYKTIDIIKLLLSTQNSDIVHVPF